MENRINRDDNRLGVAVQLCTLPWLGWIPDDLTGCPLAAVARLAIALAIDPLPGCVILPRPGEQELIEQLAPAPADARAVRLGAKAAGAVLLAGFLVVAWRGPDDSGRTNPAPTWFYVWFWVGLVPLSLLLGPIWKLISPLRTIAGLLGLLGRGPVGVADRLGYWPAVFALLAFLWLELLYDFAASPRMAHSS